MRRRDAERLIKMVAAPPRMAPRWLTPEMVKQATPLDGLDIVARGNMRITRILLLAAVARRAVDDLRLSVTGSGQERS